VYDSQIHTPNVATVTAAASGNASNCNPGDLIPTDAYVLQSGAPTGCDPGDVFEGNQADGHLSLTSTSPAYKFDITTHYQCPLNGSACDISPQKCSTGSSGICSSDSAFLTITNGGASTFAGTITLSGVSGGSCPGGVASDFKTETAFITGGSETLTLSTDSSACGGFNRSQPLNLTANQESKAFFGKDDYVIKPLNSVGGDTLDVLPVPLPSSFFSPGTTFPTLKCIPYADFSAATNPVCVELQLHPSGPSGGNYLYTATNDFNIDKNSLPNGVGGPSFLGHHGFDCPPDSGFNINIFFTYTAPDVTFGDPLKGGGSGTGSCWVAAFDPNAVGGPISTGSNFSFFEGFQSPVSDTDVNLVKQGSSVPLIFKLFSSPGVGNPNFSLCPGMTVPTSNVCPSTLAKSNWVFFGTVKTACMSDPTPNDDTLFTVASGSSALQNFGDGTYQYNLKTQKPASGCFDAVLIFDSGLTLFPANFKYKQ